MSTDPDQPSAESPSNGPLKLALAGFAVAVVLFGAAALPVLRNRDNITADSVTTTTFAGGGTVPPGPAVTDPPVTPPVNSVTTDAGIPLASSEAGAETTDPVGGATTTIVPLPGTPAPASTSTTTIAPTPTTTIAPTTIAGNGGTTTTVAGASGSASNNDVPESMAIVKGGKIYLQGAVPDEESARTIVELAAEILGEQNVVNEYIVDPRASDPNLGNIRVDDTVLFEPESAVIAPEFEPLLNQGLALMNLRPSVTFRIVGHTDSRGADDYNLLLSIARAQAVVKWLTDRGIDPDRLSAEGRGELDPIASNDTAVGRDFNRRIQVFIENLLVDDN